jgi:hypothetical protein
MKGELRVMFTRHRKDLTSKFKEAGKVVVEGADVGGDVRVAWDPDNETEVKAVGKLFDELKEAGFTAVKVGDDGKLKDGQRIEKFEKSAGRMVMLPKMQGGAEW